MRHLYLAALLCAFVPAVLPAQPTARKAVRDVADLPRFSSIR